MPSPRANPTGVDLIALHSRAVADLGASGPADAPVPTCAGWTVADLVWHLAEVQDFWAHVIRHRPAEPDGYAEPNRPGDDDLPERLRVATEALVSALAGAEVGEPAWSWAPDRTVGFTVRRQTQEAWVHHVDAALARGAELPAVDPGLAADGVDELLTVFLSDPPGWATFTATGDVVRLAATDTGDGWTVALGRMTGTDPATGTTHDLDAIELDAGADADVTVSAPARELALWLWGRLPETVVTLTGDAPVAARLRDVVVDATQ